MTTPPPVLPARVVKAIERHRKAAYDRGCAISDAIFEEQEQARINLLAAIADAIEEAELRVLQEHCAHLWHTTTGICIHCGARKP